MIVVGGLAIDRFGRVLMGLRPHGKPRPAMWEYPGGKVELNETPGEALVREWKEELGLDVCVGELISRVEFEVEYYFNWALCRVYLAERSYPQPLAHDQVLWFDPRRAIERLPCTPTTYLSFREVAQHVDEYMRSRNQEVIRGA